MINFDSDAQAAKFYLIGAAVIFGLLWMFVL